MRITLEHSTVYRYDAPVFLEPHVFRLRPRGDASQEVLRHALQIIPAPAGRTDCLDQDGNISTVAWFVGPALELAVRSSFEVETLRENPFDFLLASPDLATLPLIHPPPLAAALAPYAVHSASDEVREFARTLADANGWRTLDFLGALTHTLFETTTHIVRDEGSPLPAEETLRSRTGSCRDVAVLFCAVARTLGIPSRFVSGYECGPGFAGHAHMHAWAEVYLDGGGWRGYDPARGLATAATHVAVAAAADPILAAPMSGTFRGRAGAEMQYQISVRTGE